MFTSIKRACRLGWKNFKRSGGLSVVAIVVLVATSFLATSLLLAQEVSRQVVEDIESRADISVYFDLATPEDEIIAVAEDIRSNFEVTDIEYNSRHDVLEGFRDENQDREDLMEALDEIGNPFFATLDIKAENIDNYREIADYVRSNYLDIVDEIDFYRRKEAIESIFAVTSRVQNSLTIIGSILAIISILIVFGTIRLSIYSLNKEIKIMKLVGASDYFMQGSFLVQGFILGFTASVISFLILMGMVLIMHQGYNPLGINLESHILDNLSYILLLQFLTGIGLSVASSFVAVRKYLEI